jgi:putative glutamine amidotransferase
MQLMNVAAGGTLLQDVYASTGLYHDDYSRWREGVHQVKLEPHSQLADALGVVELAVNSVHHQGLDRLGDGLRAVAWAEDDTVEGVELDGAAFAVGVQWHPEVLEDDPEQQGIFRAFVKAAAAQVS